MKDKTKKTIASLLFISTILSLIPVRVFAEKAKEDESSIQRAYVYNLVIGGMCISQGGSTYYIDMGTIEMYGRYNGKTAYWAPDGTIDGNAKFEIIYYDIYGSSYNKGSAFDIYREWNTGYACPL